MSGQLSNFPLPFPDESFYSLAARFSERMRFSAVAQMHQALFGRPYKLEDSVLPTHLESLIERVPPENGLTLGTLIERHTPLSFYAAFLPPDMIQLMRFLMRGGDGSARLTVPGCRNWSVPSPMMLRYCPFCARDDRTHFSECYWHRLHQLPGITLCARHEIPLQDSVVSTQKAWEHTLIPAERAIARTIPPLQPLSAEDRGRMKRLAQDAGWLLNQRGLTSESTTLRDRYRALLDSKGFINCDGRVRAVEMSEALVAHYSSEFLARLGCSLERGRNRTRLNYLVDRSERRCHPIHHLLLLGFLGCTTSTFFSTSQGQSFQDTPEGPFGIGPWPCLNPVCERFREPCIIDCDDLPGIYRGRDAVMKRFACACGFIYKRYGPDRSPEDRFRRGWVEAYGPIWEAGVRAFWLDPAVNQVEMARRLGVHIATVQVHARRLGLPFPCPGSYSKKSVDDVPVLTHGRKTVSPKQHEYRSAWEDIRERYPDWGTTAIRRAAPRAYGWLYRFDRDWLRSHSPERASSKGIPTTPWIDWDERDRESAETVCREAARRRALPGLPERITKKALKGALERRLSPSQLLRMPMTFKSLDDESEIHAAFWSRRIWWACEQYQREAVSPTREELERRARVNQHVAPLPEVQQAIASAIATLRAYAA